MVVVGGLPLEELAGKYHNWWVWVWHRYNRWPRRRFLGWFGATASTNLQGGFANNNMQMNPSGVLPGAAMQSQADYRMQYFDLGLMKYQEIKNASGKHDHLKRFFYEEINKFQYVVEQQDTLCRDISRTYINAHRSLLTKLDQEVYRMEQDVNEVKNMLGKHRKCNPQQNVLLILVPRIALSSIY